MFPRSSNTITTETSNVPIVENQKWRPLTGNIMTQRITYSSACIHDSNEIPTAKLVCFGWGNTISLLQRLSDSFHVYFRLHAFTAQSKIQQSHSNGIHRLNSSSCERGSGGTHFLAISNDLRDRFVVPITR